MRLQHTARATCACTCGCGCDVGQWPRGSGLPESGDGVRGEVRELTEGCGDGDRGGERGGMIIGDDGSREAACVWGDGGACTYEDGGVGGERGAEGYGCGVVVGRCRGGEGEGSGEEEEEEKECRGEAHSVWRVFELKVWRGVDGMGWNECQASL